MINHRIAVQRRVISARAENEARIQALRDSVGFLAHELNEEHTYDTTGATSRIVLDPGGRG